MLTLIGAVTATRKSANSLIKLLREAKGEFDGWTICKEHGALIVYVAPSDCSDWEVLINGAVVRKIPRDLVVQTARLFADAQRLRKKSDKMIIQPI